MKTREELLLLKTKKETAETEFSEAVEETQKHIAAGASFGDPIDDYLFCIHGLDIPDNDRDLITGIDALLQEHGPEGIAIQNIRPDWYDDGYTREGRTLTRVFALDTPYKWRCDSKGLHLPIQRYLWEMWDTHSSGWEISAGPLFLSHRQLQGAGIYRSHRDTLIDGEEFGHSSVEIHPLSKQFSPTYRGHEFTWNEPAKEMRWIRGVLAGQSEAQIEVAEEQLETDRQDLLYQLEKAEREDPSSIPGLLRRADDLGMYQWNAHLNSNLTPGARIAVAEYVRGLEERLSKS